MMLEWTALLWLGLAPVPVPAATNGDEEWIPARPDFAWEFPGDHWSHPGYRTEWWYFTGHLQAEDGRSFGYQFTFFRVGLLAEPPAGESRWNTSDLIMGHAAISDLQGKEHRFSELLVRATPFLGGVGAAPDPQLVWSRAPVGTDGRWTLDWNGTGFDLAMVDEAQGMAFQLSTTPARPRIFQGPNGFSRKGGGPSNASLYYSYPRLDTQGTVTLDGATWKVRGSSWMDKEFGSNQLGEQQVGWDWFSLQLGDDRDLMLYVLRDKEGRIDHASGTLVAADGTVTWLDPEDWVQEQTGQWTSEESGITYPARWRLRLPEHGLDLRVIPAFPDQENRSRLLPGLHYWEGAVQVLDPEGRVAGQGYVELTGYGAASRPGI